MARVGGRNSWIAVPAGIACAAIVAVLVWLSLPMVPVAVTWAGEMLRNATTASPESAPADTPASQVAQGATVDCHAMYPESLWNDLTWQSRALLDQSSDPPATAATSLIEVLTPDVRLTCAWTASDGGTVASTLAVIPADAQGIAEAALRGQGFACTVSDAVLRCARTEGDDAEAHVLRDGLWLSSIERSWHPDDYASRLERQVFG